MQELSIILLLSALLTSFISWRTGFSVIVIGGLLQDPLRKLVPDQPVYFVMFVALIFCATYLGAVKSGVPLYPGVIAGWRRSMDKPFKVFLFLVLLQGLHSLIRFSSLKMTTIGLIVWLFPIAAVILTYQFAIGSGMARVRSWVKLYCIFAIIFLGSVFLQFAGVEWAALGEVGEGIKIYDVGSVLEANSGFFRSSEIAAWHASTASCFLFILSLGRRLNTRQFILTVVLVSILVSLGLLTGRRKMLLEVSIFFVAYLVLIAVYQSKRRLQALSFLIIGVIALSTVLSTMGPETSREAAIKMQLSKHEEYSLRGQSVFGDAQERLLKLGFAPVGWAVNSVGWLGTGLGTGSQGSQGIADDQRNIWAAEGGLGKITVELGVPGLLLVLWLLIAFLVYLRRLLRETNRHSLLHARFASGLVAFILAKAASFSVAAQAYSDPFILIIMGIAGGFLLAMPILARYEHK